MKAWKQLLAGAIVLGARGFARGFCLQVTRCWIRIDAGRLDALGLVPAPPSEESAADDWGGGSAPQVKAGSSAATGLAGRGGCHRDWPGRAICRAGRGSGGPGAGVAGGLGAMGGGGCADPVAGCRGCRLEVERAHLMLEDARATLARQEQLAGSGATSIWPGRRRNWPCARPNWICARPSAPGPITGSPHRLPAIWA